MIYENIILSQTKTYDGLFWDTYDFEKHFFIIENSETNIFSKIKELFIKTRFLLKLTSFGNFYELF